MKAPRFKGWFARLLLQLWGRTLDRPARRRGGRASKPGISNELDCILVARDRDGNTIDAVTGRGALTAAWLEHDSLPRLHRQVLLVIDSNPAYRAFTRRHMIAHDSQPARGGGGRRLRHGVNGTIHVQNVNSDHQRFNS